MNSRKTPDADLRSRYTVFLQIGFVLVLGLLILAARADIRVSGEFKVAFNESDDFLIDDVVVTKHEPAPPPPVRKVALDSGAEVFVIVEEMPELIGGLASLQRGIHYPEIAKKAGVEGRVIVSFVVNKTGGVDDPVVVRGIGAGCDEEALGAVSRARFKPGKQRGQAVNVKMSLPITFRLK
ncbi:MAG: protein TonB [Thalassolituus oleivorans]|jgi:protein TonB